VTDADLMDAERQAKALMADSVRLASVDEELAVAHLQLAQWREAVVAANRISQTMEARAVAAESLVMSLRSRLDAEHAAHLEEIRRTKEAERIPALLAEIVRLRLEVTKWQARCDELEESR
jgi:hypothetical protein